MSATVIGSSTRPRWPAPDAAPRAPRPRAQAPDPAPPRAASLEPPQRRPSLVSANSKTLFALSASLAVSLHRWAWPLSTSLWVKPPSVRYVTTNPTSRPSTRFKCFLPLESSSDPRLAPQTTPVPFSVLSRNWCQKLVATPWIAQLGQNTPAWTTFTSWQLLMTSRRSNSPCKANTTQPALSQPYVINPFQRGPWKSWAKIVRR